MCYRWGRHVFSLPLHGLDLCLKRYGDIFQELSYNDFWLEVVFYFKKYFNCLNTIPLLCCCQIQERRKV